MLRDGKPVAAAGSNRCEPGPMRRSGVEEDPAPFLLSGRRQRAARRFRQPVLFQRPSVAEVQTVQAGSVQPLVSSRRQVHREVHVTAQGPEPGGMESLHGGDVAGHRADR
jgi:hypothetical protein